MPHISVKMLKGRTVEQKKRVAEALAKTLQKELGVSDTHVSVTVEDFSAEDWQQIFKQEVTDKPDYLYIKPKYDPKDLL